MTHDPLICPCGVDDPDPSHYCPDDLWDESAGGYFSDYAPIVTFLTTFAARVRSDERRAIHARVSWLYGPAEPCTPSAAVFAAIDNEARP